MSHLRLLSPAKINLFLHITGRRADGYHKLQTVFQLLDVGDSLDFELRDSGTHISPPIPGVPQAENLIAKAAQLLRKTTGCEQGISIKVNKILPMGGGLGGGSSNAATTLVALNYLWKTGLDLETLCRLGCSLGADVPVFVRAQSAWAEGIGEQLKAIALPERYYLILCPPCEVSTASVFKHKNLTRNTAPITVAAFLEEGGNNDCQPLVERLYPQVKDAVDWLKQHGRAQMTGTGACVFASFSTREEANTAFANCPSEFNGFVAKGVDKSPLYPFLP